MGLSDHGFRSIHAFGLCSALGGNRCTNPASGGVQSPHRRPTPDLYISECPGIGHCLALGAIGRNDYHCFPAGSAFVGSNSSEHSRFPPFSGSLSCVNDNNYPWSIIPGVLVAIEKEGNSSARRITNSCSRPCYRVPSCCRFSLLSDSG